MQIRLSSNQETSSPREIRFLYRPARERERIIRRVSFGIIHYDPPPLSSPRSRYFSSPPPSCSVPFCPFRDAHFSTSSVNPAWNLHRGRLGWARFRFAKNWIVKNSLKKSRIPLSLFPFFIFIYLFIYVFSFSFPLLFRAAAKVNRESNVFEIKRGG